MNDSHADTEVQPAHTNTRDIITRRWPRGIRMDDTMLVDWIDEKGSIVRLITSRDTTHSDT